MRRAPVRGAVAAKSRSGRRSNGESGTSAAMLQPPSAVSPGTARRMVPSSTRTSSRRAVSVGCRCSTRQRLATATPPSPSRNFDRPTFRRLSGDASPKVAISSGIQVSRCRNGASNVRIETWTAIAFPAGSTPTKITDAGPGIPNRAARITAKAMRVLIAQSGFVGEMD